MEQQVPIADLEEHWIEGVDPASLEAQAADLLAAVAQGDPAAMVLDFQIQGGGGGSVYRVCFPIAALALPGSILASDAHVAFRIAQGACELNPVAADLLADIQAAHPGAIVRFVQFGSAGGDGAHLVGVLWGSRVYVPTFPPGGPAGGDLAGTYPNPEVVALEETGGARLAIGAIPDGDLLVRSGASVVGEASITDTQHGARGGGGLHPVATANPGGVAGFASAGMVDHLAGLPLPTTPAQDGYLAQAAGGALAWEASVTGAQHGNQSGGTLHAVAVAGVSNGFESAADKAKLDGFPDVAGQPNLAALAALISTGWRQGSVCFVTTLQAYFLLDYYSHATPDGITVIAAVNAVANVVWCRMPPQFGGAANVWLTQAAWHIDSAIGNDENPGNAHTTGGALATPEELARRLSLGSTLQQSTAVYIWSNGAKLVLNLRGISGTVLRILGQSTAQLYSGVLTAKTDLAPTAAPHGQPQEVQAGAIGDWSTAGPGATSLVGARLRLTSGAPGVVAATSWVAKRLTATNARTGPFVVVNPAAAFQDTNSPPAAVLPAGTETFTCESSPLLSAVDIRFCNDTDGDCLALDGLDLGAGIGSTLRLEASGKIQVSRSLLNVGSAELYAGNGVELLNCSAPLFAGSNTMWAARGVVSWQSCVIFSQTFYVIGLYVALTGQNLMQGAMLSVAWAAGVRLGDVGFYDGALYAMVANNATFIYCTGYVFGAGAANVAVRILTGGYLEYVTQPIVTGAGGDTKVAASVKTWAAHPAWSTTSIPANACGIVAY